MTKHARGMFQVQIKPLGDDAADSSLARMSIDKEFHGELKGTSKGQMLAAATTVKDSAGYVAIERVTGTLQNRHGTFLLQHHGLMSRGTGDLRITVIPDSGTDQLLGLAGTMTIIVAGGEHSYDFEYSLG